MQASSEEPPFQSWPSQPKPAPVRVLLSYGHRRRQSNSDSSSDSTSTNSPTDDSDDRESRRIRGRAAAPAPTTTSPVVIVLALLLILCLALAVYFGVRNFRYSNLSNSSSSGSSERSAANGGNGVPGTVTETVVTVSTVGSDASSSEDRASPTQTTTSRSRPSTDSQAAPTNSGASSSGGSSTASDDPFIQSCLNAHNGFRNQHHADSLTWNTTLQAAAQKWANHCVWEHSEGKVGPYGENLFAFAPIQQDQALDPTGGIDGWNSEEKDYDYSKPTGFSHETGHFTQSVWIGTKQVGCAFARCKGFLNSPLGAFLVCEYWPGGNIVTDDLKFFKDNVKPP